MTNQKPNTPTTIIQLRTDPHNGQIVTTPVTPPETFPLEYWVDKFNEASGPNIEYQILEEA